MGASKPSIFSRTPLTLALLTTSAITPFASQAAAQALEEVVVTAQRRTQTLQEVPIAVTAFDQQAMTEANLFDVAGVSQLTPGLTISTHSLGRPQVYIRGIGSNAVGAGADNSVVSFIDEVYIGRSAGTAFDLYDLERVEVLRGPQGTLYGKNAIGGAINYITTKPTDQFYAKGEVLGGNLGLQSVRGLVSGPLTDTTSGKVSLNYRERDGYTSSVFLPEDMGTIDRLGLRAALRSRPTETLELNLTIDYSEADEIPVGRNHGYDPTHLYTGAGLAFDEAAFRDPFTTFSDDLGFEKVEVGGISLRADWTIGTMTLTSISAYRESEYEDFTEIGFWSTAINPGIPDSWGAADESSEQFSQELRLAGTGLQDRLEWVTGLYYLNEKVSRDRDLKVFVAATRDTPLGLMESESTNETKSYSAFADGTYNLTENVSITAGIRYTYEEKDISQKGIAPQVIAHSVSEDYDITADESWNAATPRLSLNWNVTDSALLYFSVAEGFKSGGFDGGPASNEFAARTPFDPEEARQYEIGAKTDWFANTLRVNMALFSTDYTDLQVLQRVPAFPGDPIGITVTQNAANATTEGVEMEFSWAPLAGLEISGNYAYLDATYDEYLEPDGTDNSGNVLRLAPENSYALITRYAHQLATGAELGVRWQYIYKDETSGDPRNAPFAVMPEWDTQSLRLWYGAPGGAWQVSAWVDNLTDEEYSEYVNALPPFTNAFQPALPRTYGLTFEAKFGSL
jgi:iron complex outermembrane receptor protein